MLVTNIERHIAQDILTLKKEVSILSGRQAELADRADELTKNVGKAKGELDLKEETEGFLERLQHSYHEKTLGSYERLLTAVTEDVMGLGNRIKLDLFTERGAPALDITAETYDPNTPEDKGFIVDLLSNSGGSMTNVISMGLRCIATLRSGLRPFLALDETDIWLSHDRVGDFYNVLEQLSNEHGLQALVISHHKINTFGPHIRILEIIGHPHSQEGVQVVVRSWGKMWENETEKGIRSIRLRDFCGFKDGLFPLGPGLNVIIGGNNLGKSRVMWALRGVAYGGSESNDSFIRHGKKRTDVDIILENNMHLSWSREQKRNPTTLWTLENAKTNKIMEVNGQFCSTGGKTPPEWLESTLGIGRVDGLEIQLSRQLKPVFLLDETSSKRATVLSMGRESNYLRTMIDNYKELCKDNQAIVKDGERELTITLGKLSHMAKLGSVVKTLEDTERQGKELTELSSVTEGLKRLYSELQKCTVEKTVLTEKLKALRALEDKPVQDDKISQLKTVYRIIMDSKVQATRNYLCLKAINGLTDRPTKIDNTALKNISIKMATDIEILKVLKSKLSWLKKLDTQPARNDLSPLYSLQGKLRQGTMRKTALVDMLGQLSRIPEIPNLPNWENLVSLRANMSSLLAKQQETKDLILDTEKKLLLSKQAIEKTLAQQGNKCITCGSDVTFDKLHERVCL